MTELQIMKKLFAVVAFGMSLLSGEVARAAVTEVYVANGHTLFNVEQRLSKRARLAKNHGISGSCISADADAEGQTANPAALQVGTVTSLNNGRYKFNLHADYTAKPGKYIVQFRDNKLRANKNLEPKLTVYIKQVAVTAISFLGGESNALGIRRVSSLGQSTIQAYEWKNGSLSNPGAWVRGGTKQIKVQLRGPANNTFNVWAEGTWGGIDVKSIKFDTNGAATELMTIDQFPEVVAKVDAGWNWKVSRQNVQTDINSTGHRFYVVYDTPLTSANYEELYEFGCGWASGQITSNMVTEKIWLGLSSGKIRLANDGANAPYWRYWGSNASGNASSNYQQLFVEKDGQCGAWAVFGAELLKMQGIPAYVHGIVPDEGKVVGKNGVEGLRYSLTVKDSADHQGDPENGWTSPRGFQDHALTRKNFSLYDPSFHNGEWTDTTVLGSLNKFENDSIKNFGVAKKDSTGEFITDANGNVAIFDEVDNTPVREMVEKIIQP